MLNLIMKLMTPGLKSFTIIYNICEVERSEAGVSCSGSLDSGRYFSSLYISEYLEQVTTGATWWLRSDALLSRATSSYRFEAKFLVTE